MNQTNQYMYVRNHPSYEACKTNKNNNIYMSDDLKKQTGCGSVDDKSERVATSVAVPDTNLRFIGQERRHTGLYCHFHEARALETWYIYEDKNSNVIESKTLRQNIVTAQPKK